VLYLDTHVSNPLVGENVFLTMAPEESDLPTYGQARDVLPNPYWAGHQATIDCYWKTWELAFGNLRRPTPENGFVANYIDTAFNDHLFMWDSTFILLFARYGRRAFDFQRTLDNLYAKQHPDGFICREVRETDGSDVFCRFDPASTGPNVMPWCEWEHYCEARDLERLARVFPVLLAYHRWLRDYRTWKDGTYWSSGWACGMDNQPRVPGGEQRAGWYHGHLSWIDACLQQVISGRILTEMAAVLGRSSEAADLPGEVDHLSAFINTNMWDEKTGFYHDLRRDGTLSDLKSVAAFWALLAEVADDDRAERLVAHLSDEGEFSRPHRVPTLSADHPAYRADGGYWLGGVWAPTNYMILRGLQGRWDDLAHEIALNHVENVTAVYEDTGTLWENYAPEVAAPGSPAKGDFVGWTGLAPVAVLFEYVFGLRPTAEGNRLLWDVRLTEEHGVTQYPLGGAGLLDLHCAERASGAQKPEVQVTANQPVELVVCWAAGSETLRIEPAGQG